MLPILPGQNDSSRSLLFNNSAMNGRRSPSPAQGNPRLQNGGRILYRMHSNTSSTSIFENVEMAQDEVRQFGRVRLCPRC